MRETAYTESPQTLNFYMKQWQISFQQVHTCCSIVTYLDMPIKTQKQQTFIAIAQCQFFAEYMEASTKQIDNSILDTSLLAKQHELGVQKNIQSQQQQNPNQDLENQIANPQQQQNLIVKNQTSNNQQWTFQIIGIQYVQNTPLQNKEKYNINKFESLLTQMVTQNNLKDIQSLKFQDYLFFPVNQQNHHWICLIISLKEKKIRFFDSYKSYLNEDIITAAKEILKFIGVTMISEYAITTHFNKQNNGYDCGIFTLLSLLYTYQNLPYDYNQQIVTKYRQSILYNLAIVGSQIEVSQELVERIIKLQQQ